jgi:hypothetical protein
LISEISVFRLSMLIQLKVGHLFPNDFYIVLVWYVIIRKDYAHYEISCSEILRISLETFNFENLLSSDYTFTFYVMDFYR